MMNINLKVNKKPINFKTIFNRTLVCRLKEIKNLSIFIKVSRILISHYKNKLLLDLLMKKNFKFIKIKNYTNLIIILKVRK